MYINKVDETVDEFIDDFYDKIVTSKFTKYYDEQNFVKYQKDINNLLVDYFDDINKDRINKVLNNKDNTEKLFELIKKYIAYYTMLTIGFFYKYKYDTYVNNVIEFSKNQSGFNLKIDDFFNSDSNSKILGYYGLIKNILVILDADNIKLANLAKKKEFIEPMEFLNMFGKVYVDEHFRVQNLGGVVSKQAHNIIKTIIIGEIYIKQDKQNIHLFLEQSEIVTGEFIYIDIVIQTSDVIDYNTIESVLTRRDIENGLVSTFYDLISENNRYTSQTLNHDQKIIALLNSGYVIPVAEDFMLYSKDTENYDKYINKLSVVSKKKEEPKIKYIVNKIESVEDYYSPIEKEKLELINKNFDPLLSDRMGVIVNHMEDIKIISKIELVGQRFVENNEYYNDLKTFMKYPYINFSKFKDYGFGVVTPKYIDVIRSISMDEIGKNKVLQIRSSNPNNILNIVGLIIPNTNYDIKCAGLNNIISSKNVKKKNGTTKNNTNGYNVALNFIKKNIGNDNDHNIYWKFDLENDKVKFDNYDITNSLDTTEQVKLIMVKLYDDTIRHIYDVITKNLDKKKISMQMATKYLVNICNKVMDISKNKILYDDYIKKIYLNNLIKYKDEYDTKMDIITGLTGKVIKLPTYKKEHKSNMDVIILKKNIEATVVDDQKETYAITAICQHNITWDNLMALRKKEPNKFNDILFSFFIQYVDKTYDDQYICKSCGALVNIASFVQESSYDDEGHFVSFNVTINIPLEDIPEYEKYKSSIRNLEKTVEKFASIFKINTLIGGSNSIKMKIRQIVKDSIDLMLIHNTNLKHMFKIRTANLGLYGINKDYSNLFTFELENSIFVYSSTDKDYYKNIKKNNIYIYLLFFMLLEISDNQIIFMIGDKICNYNLFAKFGGNLFDGLNIKKGNSNTVTPLRNYRVLCYVLFYMSCLMTKYNLWFYEQTDDKKKFNPIIQKMIIHTFVDFVNSVIEVFSSKNKKYIYDIVVNKFFQKLNGTFSNNDLLVRLKNLEEKKILDKRSKFELGDSNKIVMTGEYAKGEYMGDSLFMYLYECRAATTQLTNRINTNKLYYDVIDVTNCKGGTFHKWEYKNKDYVCSICGRVANEKANSISQDTIKENYMDLIMEKTAKKYCASGNLHNCIEGKCIRCDVDIDKNVDRKELEKIYNTVKKLKLESTKKHIITTKKDDTKKNIINELKNEYGETKVHKEDYFKFIDLFINRIESVVGKDYNVSNKNIFLRYDAYIIDYDHNGYPLDNPVMIIDKDNKIIFKKNHPFFGVDVFYYINNKLGIEVYYNAINRILLGYKENNKEYQKAKNHCIKIKINYSVMNMIKLFGYEDKLVKVRCDDCIEDKKIALENAISDIGKERINILKKILKDTQRYVFRFANNYYAINRNIEDVDMLNFVNKYKDKLNKISLSNDKYTFLDHWETIKDELFYENIHNKIININADDEYTNADTLSNYDYSGNLILFYIIREMLKLMDINDDKYNKTNIVHLLLDMIVSFYNEYGNSMLTDNRDIKRFAFMLTLNDYADISEDFTAGYYDEYKNPDEPISKELRNEVEDIQEENEALDMEDVNQDYEGE